MSKLSNTRSVRTIYPGRLLLIDYGLNEKTIEDICHGLDKLFSIITTYVGIQRIPMFGLIVNGQNQSEIFIPFAPIRNNQMELQVALCKLQLLGQKWSMKSTRTINSSLSWHSALHLAFSEINSDHRATSNSNNYDCQIVILTDRLTDSIISDIHQYIQNHQIDKKKIELVCINDNDQIELFKQNILLSDLLNIKYIYEDKYSIGLYLKSWLLNNDHDNEHMQIFLPTDVKTDHIDQSWSMIRCDLQEILNDPHHHINHERFFIYTEPSRISTSIRTSSILPIYQLKALNFIKQTNYCISMIFGMPLLVLPTACHKYDIEKNEIAFDTLIEYLRRNELMLICRLNDSSSINEFSSGHFILSYASERCLLLRSIASSEFLFPLPNSSYSIVKHEEKHIDQNLFDSLSSMHIDDEEYNPLYYEARRSKITISTNLI